jgi:hypothetical protein
LTILCLIYSIPHPSPLDRPVGDHSSSTPPNQVSQITSVPASASSSGLPHQIESTVSLSESDRDAAQFPDAPGDIHPEEHAYREDTATIRRKYLSKGADELGSDSERELRAHGPTSRQRESETSFPAYRHQQQKQNQYSQHVLHDQNVPSYRGDGYNTDTPRRLHSSGSNATPLPRSYSQDAPTSVPASSSLSLFRNSIIPPPRPPPSGPLPTRPRIANGTVIPPQLLNQPLPPLPPIPKPQVLYLLRRPRSRFILAMVLTLPTVASGYDSTIVAIPSNSRSAPNSNSHSAKFCFVRLGTLWRIE